MDSKADPIILDLLKWLRENLPSEADDDTLCRKVKRVQKVFDTMIGLSIQEFYNHALGQLEQISDCQSLESAVDSELKHMKDYITLNDEKTTKTKKLHNSRAKLDLKKEQYELIKSIKLDQCMDLISRYNHLLSKK